MSFVATDNGPAPAATDVTKSKFEELSELLRDAEGRNLSALELKLVKTLLSSPLTDSDREDEHLTRFLSTALDISVKWKYLDIWNLALSRFESLGASVLEPEMALKALCAFEFEPIKPQFVPDSLFNLPCGGKN